MCKRYRMLGGDSGKTESIMPDSNGTPYISDRRIRQRNARLPECWDLNPKSRRYAPNTAHIAYCTSTARFLGRVRENFRRQTASTPKGHGGSPNHEEGGHYEA